MNLVFCGYPLRSTGYSDNAMTVLDPEPKARLAAIIELALLETGDRRAREHWQQTQLQNLLKHAAQRSSFWRGRIGTRRNLNLAAMPVLTRQELRQQVALEGPLLGPSDGIPTDDHATSGSSGSPVKFFVSGFNGRYNEIRALAQYFIEGRDLSRNHTRVKQTVYLKEGVSVEKHRSWMGPLGSFIKSGASRTISLSAFATDKQICRKLVQALQQDDIGYLICSPKHVEMISTAFDLDFLKAAKTEMWISFGEHLAPQVRAVFAELSIPIRANYSAEEVGMIGAECSQIPGSYHVATSNVIVESVDQSHDVEGFQVGRVLVTHLHSYATPFIRYDIGDLAAIRESCPCGHDGPSIYNLQGRFSRILKRRDGRLSSLHLTGTDLAAVVEFSEYRMRQTALDEIVLELGGRSELNDNEIAAVTDFLRQRTGEEFSIKVTACSKIDWGESRKRPGFRCEI